MTENTKVDNIDYSFIGGGPLYRLFTRAGLAQPGLAGVRGRATAVVVLTYLPILALSVVQGVAWDPALRMPFLWDITETCRFLLVAPMLIATEALVDPWIVQVVRYVRDRLLVKEEWPRYQKLIASAVRWRDSNLVEILLLVSTFGWQWVEAHVIPQAAITTWHQLPSSSAPTYAFLWCIYISKPLVRFLWLRWIWRYLVWTVFLVRLARMPLKIVPTYPDRHGGLGIIALGHGRFAALALTFGVQTASILGEQMIYEGKTLMSFKFEIIGIVAIVLLTFLTPLLTFTGRLLNAKRTGLFECGVLTDQVASAFYTKWIGGGEGDEQILRTGEAQSLSAVGQTYLAVRNMSVSLIGRDNIMMFAGATLLPFAPLFLIDYPFDELMKHVLKAVM